MKWRDNLITFVLFAVLFLAVVAVIALFGGAVMKWFGFTYDSIGSIVLFFLLATLLSLPLSCWRRHCPGFCCGAAGPGGRPWRFIWCWIRRPPPWALPWWMYG